MIQEQVLLLKRKSKIRQMLESMLDSLLSHKEMLVLGSFVASAAVLRSLMQVVPSFEPITFFAVLAGMLYGSRKGFIVGASSLYISNFICFGGQGPWTVFQAFCFGSAGFIGGFFRRKINYGTALIAMTASTILFEIVMNGFSAVFWGGNVILAFGMAIPFMAMHFSTNFGLAFLLPKGKKGIRKLMERFKKRQ